MKFDRRRILDVVSPLLLLLCLQAISLAQTSPVLSGVVTDPSDAVVPGAQVTLTNKTTGLVRTDIADQSGAFIFPQLQPGQYDLKAESRGFKAIVTQSIDILVNTSSKVNLRFKELG